jgi:hypothetical protein
MRRKRGASGHHTKLPNTNQGSEYRHMDEIKLELERFRKWEGLGDRLYAAQMELSRAGILAGKLCGKRSREARAVERLASELNATRNLLEDRVDAEGFYKPPTCSPIRGAQRRLERQRCEKCTA